MISQYQSKFHNTYMIDFFVINGEYQGPMKCSITYDRSYYSHRLGEIPPLVELLCIPHTI